MAIGNKHSPIVNPPLSLKEFYILFSAIVTDFYYVTRSLLILQQQMGTKHECQ